MLDEDDPDYIAEKKRKSRELVIDIALGEKTVNEWIEEETPWGTKEYSEGYQAPIPTISPHFETLNLNISNLKTHDDVYDYVIKFIDLNTKKSKAIKNITNNGFDIKMGNGNYGLDDTDFDKYHADLRRILTRLNMCSSIISMESRLGEAKTIIVGRNNWEHFKELESKYGLTMKVIYEPKIDKNKVIVLRNDGSSSPGIMLVENNYDGWGSDFYIKETNRWDKKFCWFWIN